MDNELFELCKEVYRRTEWGNSFEDIEKNDKVVLVPKGEVATYSSDLVFGERWGDWLVPLYTSDYLLEKLGNLDLGGLMMEQSWDDDGDIWWGFGQSSGADGLPVASTPLKALLKLTLALHEVGEL